jgi:hypothetical protein
MSNESSTIVQRLWNYCKPPFNKKSFIPKGFESLEDSENLPEPDILAQEIAENLESALEQFSSIYQDPWKRKSNE